MTPIQKRLERQNPTSKRQSSSRRWGGLTAGGVLAAFGLSRRSKLGLALAAAGGVLAYNSAKSNGASRAPVVSGSLLLNCSPQDAYRFWRDFENLPLFMQRLETVHVTGDRRSRWVARGPMGARIEWNAEITNEEEGKSISWRSLPDSDFGVNGIVEFRPAPANRGTLMSWLIRYEIPGGAVGRAAAGFLGRQPNFFMRQDVRRFKALIETGEIPTTDGQSHGPRSRVAGWARAVDPTSPRKGQSRFRDVVEMQRRAS